MSSVASIDIGDAFANLYDHLIRHHPVSSELHQWRSTPAYTEAHDATVAALDDTTGIDRSVPDRAIADSPQAVYGCLEALDGAISVANDWTPSTDARTSDLQTRRDRTGSYTVEANGALLAKRTDQRQVGEAEELRDIFGVLRVSAETMDRIHFLPVEPTLDHADRGPDIPVDVRAVPLAVEDGDLVIQSSTRSDGQLIYLATPGPGIKTRIAAAHTGLVDADIGLAPEVTLDDAILITWHTTLTADSPTWVLAGTGPVDDPSMPGASANVGTATTAAGQPLKPNRAVLLNGPAGEVIAAQDKLSGFTLTPPLLATYKIPSTAPHVAHGEGMEPGRTLTVLESNIGRVAIFICEDLVRLLDFGQMLLEVGVTLLLVPVLATPIRPYRWQHDAGSHIAQRAGTTTVVFNSLTLGRFETTPSSPGAATLILVEPTEGDFAATLTERRNLAAATMTAHQDATTARTGTIRSC